MINLLKADLYRIVRGLGVYIAVLLAVLTVFPYVTLGQAGSTGGLIFVEVSDGSEKQEEAPSPAEIAESDPHALVRDIIGQNRGLIYPLAILVYVVLVADYANRTMKNTLSSAVSKRRYYLHKLLLSWGLTAALLFLNSLVVYVLNRLMNGPDYTEPIGRLLKATALQLPVMLSMTSLLVLIAVAVRKASLYNSIAIGFPLLFQLLVGLLAPRADALPRFVHVFMDEYTWESMLPRLATLPARGDCLRCFGVALSEIALTALPGYWIFKKAELP